MTMKGDDRNSSSTHFTTKFAVVVVIVVVFCTFHLLPDSAFTYKERKDPKNVT